LNKIEVTYRQTTYPLYAKEKPMVHVGVGDLRGRKQGRKEGRVTWEI
jgi:hypothetical protein